MKRIATLTITLIMLTPLDANPLDPVGGENSPAFFCRWFPTFCGLR